MTLTSTLQNPPPPETTQPDAMGGTQAAAISSAASQPNVTPPPAPAAQLEPVPEHHSFLSELLHAVGDVFGGPKNVQRVNPQTGAIESAPASTRQRIAGGIASAVRGAAAGAAEHGPGAVGRAALAGVQSADQAREIQQKQLAQQSQNVRLTNAADLEKQQVQANLAKMSQDRARGALDLKVAGKQLDEHQTALANSMQEILNIPGAKLLQHFDSNDEINSHLETVGPLLSKQYAIDLAKNNIRLIQNPKGGFDAVEVPKTAGEQPIGSGKTLLTPIIDPKTNKLTLKSDAADPSMTWDKFQQWNGNSFSAYNAAEEQATKIAEQKQVTKTSEATASKDYAEATRARSEARLNDVLAGSTAGGNTTVSGEEYLKTLPPAIATTIKAIGEGRMSFTALPRGKEKQVYVNALTRAYPGFDESKVQSYDAMRKDFTSGKTSTGINSYNTGIAHLGTMWDHVSTTNSIQLNNPMSDVHRQLDLDKQLVSTELAKAVSNGQMTEGEKKEIMSGISGITVGSYKTRIKEAITLLEGKLEAYQNQWHNGMPSNVVTPIKILGPQAEQTLNKIHGQQSSPPAGATHIAPGTDGNNHYTNAQGQDLGIAP